MAQVRPVKDKDGGDLREITRAFNRKEHHDLLVESYEPQINAVAEAGFKNLICFSGNREGMDDETQELNYPAIMKAILETGYTGYVAQEFIPARPEPLNSLKEAIHICDVA